MPNFKRASRVAALLRTEISQIIVTQLKDPRVGMVSITRIKLTDDLSYGRVFVSIIGDEKARKDALRGLGHATNFIRSALRNVTDLRFVPELEFILDDSAEYAHNIQTLLNKLQEEKDADPGDD